ncbi:MULTISPECIES: hypothetical protein [Bacillus cereus group]|uniref:hypothetical protein n=1 Tax=Bacillus cereus group TaxID=86661 RepID=UPI001F5122AF|nr:MULTISPECIES: hypothetical protein [Bacillus cereus group]
MSPVEEKEVRHMLTSSTPAKENIGPEAIETLVSFKPCRKNVATFLCREVKYVICYTAGDLRIQDLLTV